MRILALGLLGAALASAQTRVMIDEDFTTGHTSAERIQDPGEFTPEGWLVTSEYRQCCRINGTGDTAGGVSRPWRGGELVREGRFYSESEGARRVFIGKDNYQRFVSIPGVVHRNLKVSVSGPPGNGVSPRYHFPPPGAGLETQSRQSPGEAGFTGGLIDALGDVAERWALWRNGHLVHVKGDFNATGDVASNRKTWHAMTVGAALLQGKIPSIDQKISVWNKALTGKDAEATWRHVITQTSAFDYPYGDYKAYRPGEIWTYSDWNPVRLNQALARVYGLNDYHDGYEKVVKQAYFDAIGLKGWRTLIKKDRGFSQPDDGIRFAFDLEDMGRLGLLMVACGNWDGRQLVPCWFVKDLEKKQTRNIPVNYDGPNDGRIGLDPAEYPEVPYGFMTWVNTDRDLFPKAGPGWAYASGAGGHRIYWNRKYGIVFASSGEKKLPRNHGVPEILEAHLQQ